MENQTTTTEATAVIITAYDSQSAIYAAIAETLEGHRATTENPGAIASAIITRAEADSKAGESARAVLVAVAGIGALTLGAIADGADLCAPGDSGFVFSAIGARGIEVAGEKRNGTIGLAIYPAHSIDAILAQAEGPAYLLGLAQKEMGLVAFRRLRLEPGVATVAELDESAKAMPADVTDFLVRQTASAGESFRSFNDHFTLFRKALAANPGTKAPAAALPAAKAEVLKSIRSASYAKANYGPVESLGWFKDVAKAFRMYLAGLQARGGEDAATANPADVDRWLAGRDSLDLGIKPAKEIADADSVDFSAFGL